MLSEHVFIRTKYKFFPHRQIISRNKYGYHFTDGYVKAEESSVHDHKANKQTMEREPAPKATFPNSKLQTQQFYEFHTLATLTLMRSLFLLMYFIFHRKYIYLLWSFP